MHHLIRQGSRTRVGLVVESGEPREIHHFCAADRVTARAQSTLPGARNAGRYDPAGHAERRDRRRGPGPTTFKAVVKGVVKVMAKMGICTIDGYRGAQIFEALGLEQGLVDRYFTGTSSRVGGAGSDVIAEETADASPRGFPPARPGGGSFGCRRSLSVALRRRISPLQPADDPQAADRLSLPTITRPYQEYSTLINLHDEHTGHLAAFA